ncbi:hypothetical protein DSO57_1011133 [Entomophthora muscae]|uniref:Uncharacterized protein n=1 Tax=Entomophthora muscae TaxID=34485 RepID=A0ACC2U4E0_9FUNG|nr:hypothetical protein DSO57_1011133 [Entomophthora muscae]
MGAVATYAWLLDTFQVDQCIMLPGHGLCFSLCTGWWPGYTAGKRPSSPGEVDQLLDVAVLPLPQSPRA